MTEADRKKRDNIIEYVLYMYHSEDVVRSCQMNLELIEKAIVSPSDLPTAEKVELMVWYKELVNAMMKENLEDRGHLQEIIEIIGVLSYIHNMLVNVVQDHEYIELYNKAHPHLVELQAKSSNATQNPIELAFNGVYGVFTLKLKKMDVYPETLTAVRTFTDMLRYLGKKYNELREGKLEFPKSKQN